MPHSVSVWELAWSPLKAESDDLFYFEFHRDYLLSAPPFVVVNLADHSNICWYSFEALQITALNMVGIFEYKYA